MSLINDALKRASQAQSPPQPSVEAPPPLQPVLYAPPSRLPLIILPMLFTAVLGLGIWFLVKGWEVAHHLYAGSPVTTVAAREPAPVPPPSAPPRVSPAEPVPAEPVSAADAAEVVEAAAEAPVAEAPPATATAVRASVPAAAPVVEPTFPNLRLQGIFYRASNPSVMINAKTFFVGDMVEGAKVVSIDTEAVVLEWRGQTQRITLR